MDPEFDYPSLLRALIMAESSYNPNAISDDGAVGLTQVMPQFAHDLRNDVPSVYDIADRLGYGYDQRNPETAAMLLRVPEISVELGDRYLQSLIQRERGQLDDALRSYNMGAEAFDKWEAAGSNPATIDEEAWNYPGRVRGYYREYTGRDLPESVIPIRENGIGQAPGVSIAPRRRPEGLLSRFGG